MLVGAEFQTMLVDLELLHPSFSACFHSQHCLALALTETWEPLVASSAPREVGWWQRAKGGSRTSVSM